MADSSLQLTSGKYLAVKRPLYSTEVVRTDGGGTQRNSRWSRRLSTWDVTIPWCKRTSTEFQAADALFEDLLGSGRTFTFHDPVDCVDVEACILDDTLTITPNGNLVQVEFAVEEVRNSGNSP